MSYEQLLADAKELRLLSSIGSLLGWDERVYMPDKGSAHRAEQAALMARLCHERATDPKVGERLSAIEASTPDPASDIGVNVREWRRGYDRAVKTPTRLVEELARVTTRAQNVWQEARKANDFASFAPWLEKIVALKREQAQAIGFKGVAYDALLDEFEPGANTADITRLFAQLRDDLTPLVAAWTGSKKKAPTHLLEREYAVAAQDTFSKMAAQTIGFDLTAGRIDTTAHPFCCDIGPGDCRLTTRYNPRRFNDGFFGTLHEAGHGIYEQGLDPARFAEPLGIAVSLGIHESQSRLWENQVGRSKPFWEFFFPKAQATFSNALSDVKLEDFLFAINSVENSYIRVEADEVTYNLHIILRFEMEQALISGDLPVRDVPGAWNEKFTKAFGMTPPTDTLGCLQDVHWSGGGIGYFPTYTLGNLFAAQFMETIRGEMPDLDDEFRQGKFDRLKTWLNVNIHRNGMRYLPGDLCRRITGRPLSHRPLIEYLKKKYAPWYDHG